MSRVITFNRKYPAYHPRKEESTYFVEKILNGLEKQRSWDYFLVLNKELPTEILSKFCVKYNHEENSIKSHTIRAGRLWKVGDKFSPRVWSGQPYKSKQVIIHPDIEIKKTWEFEIDNGVLVLNNEYEFWGGELQDHKLLKEISKNDGLRPEDLLDWFKYPKPFDGQIICWNENIEY